MCIISTDFNSKLPNLVSQVYCDKCDKHCIHVHHNLTYTYFNCVRCGSKLMIDDLFHFNLFVNVLKLSTKK